MVRHFLRNLLVAAGAFFLIFALVQADLAFIEPWKEYVSFVISKNFSLQPIFRKVPFLQHLGDWDLRSLWGTAPEAAGR